jgi:hypothetical protein
MIEWAVDGIGRRTEGALESAGQQGDYRRKPMVHKGELAVPKAIAVVVIYRLIAKRCNGSRFDSMKESGLCGNGR